MSDTDANTAMMLELEQKITDRIRKEILLCFIGTEESDHYAAQLALNGNISANYVSELIKRSFYGPIMLVLLNDSEFLSKLKRALEHS